jgi:hypothetical protein
MWRDYKNVEKNLQAIDETSWLKQYLKEFPNGDREAQRALPFWPHEQKRNVMEDSELEGVLHTKGHSRNTEVDLIMVTMPNPEARGYFGPCRSKPSTVAVPRAPRRRASSAAQQTVGATYKGRGEDWFPPFNPENDIRVGQFVALTVEQEELHVGVPFYVEKVLEFGQRKWAEKMKVVWYWPSMRAGVQTRSRCSRTWYANYTEVSWEPSLKRHGWVVKEATIFFWEDVPARTKSGLIHENNIWVHGVVTETRIKILAHAKPHLVEYIELQMEAMDDEQL